MLRAFGPPKPQNSRDLRASGSCVFILIFFQDCPASAGLFFLEPIRASRIALLRKTIFREYGNFGPASVGPFLVHTLGTNARVPAFALVRKTKSFPRVNTASQPRPHTGGAFSRPQPDRSVVSSPNVPHQSLDRYRYPPRALRRYSVPDARKGFAYLCRRPFRPGVPTLSPNP